MNKAAALLDRSLQRALLGAGEMLERKGRAQAAAARRRLEMLDNVEASQALAERLQQAAPGPIPEIWFPGHGQ